MAGYSGTPLVRKLGIKPDATVVLVGAPTDFDETIGPLPEGARLVKRGRGQLTIWFVRTSRDLQRGIGRAVERAEDGPVWICWPKKASGVVTDVSEPVVRASGLGAGLVDYKICAVDETWSGLLFSKRRR